ncbi:MAG: WD40 domain protein beta Propeller [candidate division WWE3 bacterium GW2011_GWC1_41_7]|uniref:WD40 domain protein beta Propeller n=3 Tax=Katanobacteria TaxID=422282 RepID=A0A0G0X7Y1_UNCKA|nr:MAG: WD40 domain protein beta Propeller [candidate division WWE3 bacterium GW2011_GWC1_41_7]
MKQRIVLVLFYLTLSILLPKSEVVLAGEMGSNNIFLPIVSNPGEWVEPVVFTIDRVSVATDGTEANAASRRMAISADGRFVVFFSEASNLVTGSTQKVPNLFIHDRYTGTTTGIPFADGWPLDEYIFYNVSISWDGRLVAFSSRSANIVPGDTDDTFDVFVYDTQTHQFSMVSVSTTEGQALVYSYEPSISENGRYVAFTSFTSNVEAEDASGQDSNIYVHDLETGETTIASVSSTGEQGNGYSGLSSINADGRFVAFVSTSSNLGGIGSSGLYAYVHDRLTGDTTLVSRSSTGEAGEVYPAQPDMSGNGRYVAFVSGASNLVMPDTNGTNDVFVHDTQTDITTRVSVSSTGEQGNGVSWEPSLNYDGTIVAFVSTASNLVPKDTNQISDIFVHNLVTGVTERVNMSYTDLQSEGQADSFSDFTSISGDGRFVAFSSQASNLVEGDNNGVYDIFVHDREK